MVITGSALLAKLLMGAKAAAAGTKAAAVAGGAALKGLGTKAAATSFAKKAAAGARLAGSKLGIPPGELARSVAPDVFFGGLTALTTPGDAVDKTIAGLGVGIGGGAGGLLGRKLIPVKGAAGDVLDFATSYGGDLIGTAGADQLLRLKDSDGLTPYERQQMEYENDLGMQAYIQALNA